MTNVHVSHCLRSREDGLLAEEPRVLRGRKTRSPATVTSGGRPRGKHETTAPVHAPAGADIPRGGRRVGARIRAHDWATSPLGPVDDWPQSLRRRSASCCPRRPSGPLLGSGVRRASTTTPTRRCSAPSTLRSARPARECLERGVGRARAAVRGESCGPARPSGRGTTVFLLERHGFREETYFDVSYDPGARSRRQRRRRVLHRQRDDRRVLGERRLRTAARARRATAERDESRRVCRNAAAVLVMTTRWTFPFALSTSATTRGAGAARRRRGIDADDLPSSPPVRINRASTGPGRRALASSRRRADASSPPRRLARRPWPEQVAVRPISSLG